MPNRELNCYVADKLKAILIANPDTYNIDKYTVTDFKGTKVVKNAWFENNLGKI
jgi:hypothetical protein